MNFYLLINLSDSTVVIREKNSKMELKPKEERKISESVISIFKKQIHDLQLKKIIKLIQIIQGDKTNVKEEAKKVDNTVEKKASVVKKEKVKETSKTVETPKEEITKPKKENKTQE